MTDDQRNRSEARRQPDDQPGGGDGTGQQDRQPQRDRQPDRQQRDRLSTGFDPLSGGGQGQQGRPASDPSEVRSQFETLQDSQPGATAPEEMAAEGVGSVSDAVEAGAESGATERGGEEPGRLARWKSKLASLLPGGGDGGEEADGATGDAPSADGSDSGGSTAGGTSADGTTAGSVESGGFGVGGDAGPPTRQSTGPGQGAGSGRGSTPYGGTAPDEFGRDSSDEGGRSSERGRGNGRSENRLERGGGG